MYGAFFSRASFDLSRNSPNSWSVASRSLMRYALARVMPRCGCSVCEHCPDKPMPPLGLSVRRSTARPATQVDARVIPAVHPQIGAGANNRSCRCSAVGAITLRGGSRIRLTRSCRVACSLYWPGRIVRVIVRDMEQRRVSRRD
jgi:hypothetical protein